MIQTLNFYDFACAFADCDRSEQFTYAGLRALFDYLEQYQDDIGEVVELDVVALCCEYSEYKGIAGFHLDFSADEYPDIESIEENTIVIHVDAAAFIIANF